MLRNLQEVVELFENAQNSVYKLMSNVRRHGHNFPTVMANLYRTLYPNLSATLGTIRFYESMNLKMSFLTEPILRLLQSRNAPTVALLGSHDQTSREQTSQYHISPYLPTDHPASTIHRSFEGDLYYSWIPNGLRHVSDDIRLDTWAMCGKYIVHYRQVPTI
jgi:hypothetical protein